MNNHTAKPKGHAGKPQLPTAKQNPRPPSRDGTAHAHPHLPGPNRNLNRNPPTFRSDSLTNFNKSNNSTSLNRSSLEALGRELYKQHVEDAKYLRKRKESQNRYRTTIEHDRLRCMMELEKINESIAFLVRQEELDREWEGRLGLQRARLGEIRRRLDRPSVVMEGPMAGGPQVSGEIANPLFLPQLVK